LVALALAAFVLLLGTAQLDAISSHGSAPCPQASSVDCGKSAQGPSPSATSGIHEPRLSESKRMSVVFLIVGLTAALMIGGLAWPLSMIRRPCPGSSGSKTHGGMPRR
jgi:hypothetical protein